MPGPDKGDVLAAMEGRYTDFYNGRALLKPNGGELRGPCPVHGGFAPSFNVDPVAGLWFCHSKCQSGGDVFDFLMQKDGLTFPEALAEVAAFAGTTESVRPPAPRRDAAAPKPAPPPLDPCLAEKMHRRLMRWDWMRRWLHDERGLTAETLQRFQLGLQQDERDEGFCRITFPVFDRERRLTDIRRHLFAYQPELTEAKRRALDKTMPWAAGRRAGLFPVSVLDGATEALIVEGEADAALACQMGFTAVTGTLGAGNWKPEWTEELRGLARVVILYDGDMAGQRGARKVAAAVSAVVPDVRITARPSRLIVRDPKRGGF